MRTQKRGKTKGEEGYGDGRASIAFGDDVLLDEDAMVEALLACLNSPDYRPPTLPAVAMDLMDLSQRPEVDIDDVVRLLEQDNLIAGRILQLVQSPVYSGAGAPRSLREALMRLGLTTLRDVVLEIAMNLKVFRSRHYTDCMELLRNHSTLTAHLCRVVSQYSALEGDFAFMAGLLHDVGIAGTLLALADQAGPRKMPPDLIAIWPALDRVHEQAADIIASHWDLPDEIKISLGAHHQVMIQGHAHPLAATVAIANGIAHDLGFGLVPKEDSEADLEKDCIRSHALVDFTSEVTLERAREALHLSDPQMDLIRRKAEEIAAQFS